MASAIYALTLFFSWRRILKRAPRLINFSGRLFWLLVSLPIIYGSLTLLLFNLGQWAARARPNRFLISVASPAEVVGFNLIVVLAYALFIGILLWKRDRLKLPM